MGLPITIVVAALVIMRDPAAFADLSCPSVFSTQAWIYCGGILGVSTVLLCNITVPRVSAFRLTLLTFVGQLFTGILLDLCSKNTYPAPPLWGALWLRSHGVQSGLRTCVRGQKTKRKILLTTGLSYDTLIPSTKTTDDVRRKKQWLAEGVTLSGFRTGGKDYGRM